MELNESSSSGVNFNIGMYTTIAAAAGEITSTNRTSFYDLNLTFFDNTTTYITTTAIEEETSSSRPGK